MTIVRLCLLMALAAIVRADGLLLTVHKLADSVGIYDADTGRSVMNIPVGRKPHEFGITADGRWLFVTNYGLDTYTQEDPGGNSISVIDLRSRKVVGEIPTGEYRRPHGIERGRSGLFYVTTEVPAAVHILDPGKRRITASIRISGKKPHMMALSEDESVVWTADSQSGTVTCVSLVERKEMGQIETGGVPMGLALTRDGKRLFLVGRSDNRLTEIDAGSRKIVRQLEVPGQPVRLAFLQGESLLAATLIDSGELVLIDTQAFREVKRIKVGARAEGMGVDEEGQAIYVSAQGDNTIHRYHLPDLMHDLAIPTAAKPDPILVLRGRKRR